MADNQELVQATPQETFDLADFESMGMTANDMKAFLRWACGSQSDPPDVVQKMMVNLSSKLSVGLGINIVGNIGRQTRLTQFLEEMEKEIYDPTRISEMGEKEKMAAYKEARSTLNALQEFQRKFIVQNKEFKPESTEQERLMGRIMALPKDKLNAIISILDEGTGTSAQVVESEPQDIFPEGLDEDV